MFHIKFSLYPFGVYSNSNNNNRWSYLPLIAKKHYISSTQEINMPKELNQ